MRSILYSLISYFMLVSPSFIDVTHSQSTIGEIPLPSKDFKRIELINKGFASFIHNLSLKKPGSDVVNYRGGIFKSGADTSVAYVVDMDISGRRLEQCMDVLVRLYSEYLWGKKQVEKLKLPLPGGFWIEWQKWKEGFRPVFKGIDVSLVKSVQPDSSHQAYINYLNTIYSESHSQQFYHAYQPVDRKKVQIGDIIIKKGTKGHAIMIVDLAINDQGQMIAIIGNGDTPACQFFLLNHNSENAWIPLTFDKDTLSLPLRRKMTWDGLRRFSLPKE